MKLDVARRVVEEALKACGLLNRALLEARDDMTKEEFERLRRGIASAMGEIHCEVLRPIWKAHPVLEAEQIERESHSG